VDFFSRPIDFLKLSIILGFGLSLIILYFADLEKIWTENSSY
jgi:hypothetical protein